MGTGGRLKSQRVVTITKKMFISFLLLLTKICKALYFRLYSKMIKKGNE